MQAYKAYYENGRFVPLGMGTLPEGTQAIVTVLEEPPIETAQPIDTAQRLKDFDELMERIHEAADEPMPPIERVKLFDETKR